MAAGEDLSDRSAGFVQASRAGLCEGAVRDGLGADAILRIS